MKTNFYATNMVPLFISIIFLIAGAFVSHAQTYIKIDGNTVVASPDALKLPTWLNADQTLAADLNVRSISVIEFTIDGTAMNFSRGVSVTTVQSVPTGKIWKIESVHIQSNPNTISDWSLTGNSATTEVTNFLGTTDAKGLIFKTNSVEAMRIASGGNVGIGTTNPLVKLHVKEGTDLNLHFGATGGVTGFSARNDANSSNVKLEMQASEFHLIGGNLGLGTTSPSELLSLGLSGTTKGVISLAGNTSGKVIIQPAAAAGSYTWTLPSVQGAALSVLQNDGSGNLSWVVAGGAMPIIRTFTASGTWTKPAGLNYVEVELVGAGGAGGGAPSGGGSDEHGAGGGGGGYSKRLIAAALLGATEAVTIGAGGTGASNADGTAGGSSSFGSFCSATGGGGGESGSSGAPGSGGIGSGGDINIKGTGGGQTGNVTNNCGGAGGASQLGGGGSPVMSSTGGSGGQYGGGGAGGQTTTGGSTRSGGAGAAGIVIVKEYY